MSFPGNLYRCAFEPETTWGENVKTFSNALPIVGVPQLQLTQPKQDVGPTVQYMNGGAHNVTMPQAGTLTIDLLLTGLGAAGGAGSVTETMLITLLEHVFGNKNIAQIGSTVDAIWPAPGTGTFTAGGNFTDGGLCRIGTNAPKDGRGNGQAFAISNATTTSLTLDSAPQSPPDAADVVYAMGMAYPNESPPASTLTGLRFVVAGPSQHYDLHGCFAQSVTFTSWKPGELPRISITFGVSWWDDTNDLGFPGAIPARQAGSPIAGGSFWYNDDGVGTHQIEHVRDVSFSVELQAVPIMGHASRPEQLVVAARRTKCKASMTFVIDAKATATATAWQTWHTAEDNARKYRRIMYTLSAADGRSVAVWMPRVKPTGDRPTVTDVDGLTRMNVAVEALAVTDGVDALRKANFVLGIG